MRDGPAGAYTHCSGCGAALERCAGCGRELDPPRFCRRCGRKLTVALTPGHVQATCRDHGTSC